jgi:hypothetical protein
MKFISDITITQKAYLIISMNIIPSTRKRCKTLINVWHFVYKGMIHFWIFHNKYLQCGIFTRTWCVFVKYRISTSLYLERNRKRRQTKENINQNLLVLFLLFLFCSFFFVTTVCHNRLLILNNTGTGFNTN